jgi:sugar transferase (PEP-CTERM system associated)
MATVKIFNHHFRTPFLFLLLAELIVLFASVYAGAYMRFDELLWQPEPADLDNFPVRVLIYVFVMLLGMIAMGQYQTAVRSHNGYYFPGIAVRVSISLILGLFALLVLYYLLPEVLLGRGVLAYSLLASFIGLTTIRVFFFHSVDGRALRRRILILGAGALAKSMQSEQDGNDEGSVAPRNTSYKIHGFVEFSDQNIEVAEKNLVRPGDDIASYCKEYEIDEVVLAISDRRKQMPVQSLLDCKLSGVDVIDFVSFWERERGYLRLDMLNPSWMIFCDGCTQGGADKFFRRFFDVFVSLIILAVMFPVLVLTAILIYIESGFKGPIFYDQQRVGLNGKVFKLHKFRSMIVNAEKKGEAKWAQEGDVRITKIGNFIRKTRIDELPQIINIFYGDMSLVGPRPERPEFVDELEKKIPFYSSRHRVKPGLAGWAQLKYPYGASDEDAYNKLQYDLYYVKNHSFMMDVLVLLQTVEVILLGKGAR